MERNQCNLNKSTGKKFVDTEESIEYISFKRL
jgi:hypothetical protein